jgi:hypothetical protein
LKHFPSKIINMTAAQTIVITNGESYYGYAIAHYFLRECQKHGKSHKIRVLVRDARNVQKLKEMGADLQETNYEDKEQLKQFLHGAYSVILVPENSENRVPLGENVIMAANEGKVHCMLMWSCVGAEAHRGRLEDYYKLEKAVEQRYKGKRCITRVNFLQQFFYFWIPMIEDQNTMRMPTDHQKFAPVNLNDSIAAVYDIVTGSGKRSLYEAVKETVKDVLGGSDTEHGPMDEGHHGKCYVFTGPEALDGPKVAKELTVALQEEGGGGEEIKFEPISRDEFKQYLEKIAKEGRLDQIRGTVNPEMQKGYNEDRSGRDRDRGEHHLPSSRHLTPVCIETLCDYFDLVREGKVALVTDDLPKIINQEPEKVQEFFRNNASSFRPRK